MTRLQKIHIEVENVRNGGRCSVSVEDVAFLLDLVDRMIPHLRHDSVCWRLPCTCGLKKLCKELK